MNKAAYSLMQAIAEAKKIRRNLLRSDAWKNTDLTGACGLASILLSIAVKDVSIIRQSVLPSRWEDEHIWTEVEGTIIDITASQFNKIKSGTTKSDADNITQIHGVLVTRTPRWFHPIPNKIGMESYLRVVNEGWYNENDHARWKWISEYWL